LFVPDDTHICLILNGTMENTFDKTALETIDLLEARLKRIEYVVCGHIDEHALQNQKKTAVQRLGELEYSLHQIASKSSTVQELLKLRKYWLCNVEMVTDIKQIQDIRIFFSKSHQMKYQIPSIHQHYSLSSLPRQVPIPPLRHV
jgi:hypothetical protein